MRRLCRIWRGNHLKYGLSGDVPTSILFGGPYPMENGCLAVYDRALFSYRNLPFPRPQTRRFLRLIANAFMNYWTYATSAGDFSIVERSSRGVDLYFGEVFPRPLSQSDDGGRGGRKRYPSDHFVCAGKRQVIARAVQPPQLEIYADLAQGPAAGEILSAVFARVGRNTVLPALFSGGDAAGSVLEHSANRNACLAPRISTALDPLKRRPRRSICGAALVLAPPVSHLTICL